jgi:hypothetical protein
MAWLTHETTHWLTRFACGHIKDQCACSWCNYRASGKTETTLSVNCPECTA